MTRDRHRRPPPANGRAVRGTRRKQSRHVARGWWRPLLMVLATTAIYWNSLSAPFIFDDAVAIAENVELRQWPNVISVLTSAKSETPLSGRPVVSLTFGLNYAIGGLDIRGYRLVNLAIHVGCGLLLFGLVRRTVATLPFGSDRW